ncbi:MAG: hypothetical protein JNK15_14000 [Planctomycetes bacterium]|nr:hypothetical protein [Planctomycetota bacterium]
MNGAARAAATLALLATGGCVTGNYGHVSIDEPIADERLGPLVPGRATLADCLAALGAPNRVFEYAVGSDGASGMALLWSWRDQAGWGLDVSSGDDSIPGSVSFDAVTAELPGYMLWFGPDLVLQRARRGLVGELVPGRLRPSPSDG